MAQSDDSKLIVGLSIGTCVFIAIAIVAILTVYVGVAISHRIDHATPTVEPYKPFRPFPRGAADDAERKAKLEAELGPVNTAARGEIKNGLFSRMRARRAAIQSSCSGPVNRAPTRFASSSNCGGYVLQTVPGPTYVPGPVVQPMPLVEYAEIEEIDLSSCDQFGTCQLKKSRVPK